MTKYLYLGRLSLYVISHLSLSSHDNRTRQSQTQSLMFCIIGMMNFSTISIICIFKGLFGRYTNRWERAMRSKDEREDKTQEIKKCQGNAHQQKGIAQDVGPVSKSKNIWAANCCYNSHSVDSRKISPAACCSWLYPSSFKMKFLYNDLSLKLLQSHVAEVYKNYFT